MVAFLSLAGGDEEGRAELAEAGVERLLPDCRLAPEPRDVGLQVLADRLEPILLGNEPDDVVPGRGDPDALAQRQERRAEHEHDGAEGDADGRRPAHRELARPRAPAADLRRAAALRCGTRARRPGARAAIPGRVSPASGEGVEAQG